MSRGFFDILMSPVQARIDPTLKKLEELSFALRVLSEEVGRTIAKQMNVNEALRMGYKDLDERLKAIEDSIAFKDRGP